MAAHLSFLLILAGLTGIHSVMTVSKVSVRSRGSITIPCLYESKYTDHVKYLCKGSWWDSCSYKVKTNRPDSSGKFSIFDDKNQRIFIVTIKDLKDTDSYWCNVEINGGTDVGQTFHLSVTKGTPSLYVDDQYITGFVGEKITIKCSYSNLKRKKWCRLGGDCIRKSGLIDGKRVTLISKTVSNGFTVTMRNLTTESSGWYFCAVGDFQMPVHVTVNEKPMTTTPTPGPTIVTEGRAEDSDSVDLKSFLIPLALLILMVMVTLFIWYLLKMHKQSKAESSPFMMAEEEVTYSNVIHKRKTSHQAEQEAIYYNVVYRRNSSGQVEPQVNDVVYSTLAQPH